VQYETGNEVRNASPQPGWAPYGGEVPIFSHQVVGEPGPGSPCPELAARVEPGESAPS
jgi:hypothetical protein